MNKKIFKIYLIIILLISFLVIGLPFEFLNRFVDTIVTFSLIALFFFIFRNLFKKTKMIDHKLIKNITMVIVIILFIPYLYLGLFSAFFSWAPNRPMWQDLKVYTNDKNEKVVSEWIEISGSIYDYRDRKIIADYGNFRISYNCDIDNLKGVWKEYDVQTKTSKIVKFQD